MNWNNAKEWINKVKTFAEQKKSKLLNQRKDLLNQSGELIDFEKCDPLANETGWLNFRPLNINREEDWSAWLGELIRRSNGAMNESIFADSIPELDENYKVKEVHWEYAPNKSSRTDIVINWEKQNVYTNIEVKIRDTGFSGKHSTAREVHSQYVDDGEAKWSDIILLSSEIEEDWDNFVEENHDQEAVNFKKVTWREISLAIRRTIYSNAEDTFWCAWAYSFLGLIEQNILFPSSNFSENFFSFNHGFLKRFMSLEDQKKYLKESLRGVNYG